MGCCSELRAAPDQHLQPLGDIEDRYNSCGDLHADKKLFLNIALAMKFINLVSSLSLVATLALASPFSEKVYGEASAQLIEKRDANGQPIDPVTGKGGPILGKYPSRNNKIKS